MKMRRIISLALSVAMLAGLAGCGKSDDDGAANSSSGSNKIPQNATISSYQDKDYGFQLELPQDGEEVAVLHTSMGDIFIRLFPDGAPKAVENFKGLIKKGYYNGISFHRVISGFMIQGGDPTATGSGGKSLWGSAFEDEFCEKLMNLRGSLAMANSGVNTNGSQFFINQADASGYNEAIFDYDSRIDTLNKSYEQYCSYYSDFKSYYPTVQQFIDEQLAPNPKLVPEKVRELYKQYGGNIHLDGAWRASGGHTVFGQVYDGMDVVDAIAAVKVDDKSKPLTDVTIESAEIIKYSAK